MSAATVVAALTGACGGGNGGTKPSISVSTQSVPVVADQVESVAPVIAGDNRFLFQVDASLKTPEALTKATGGITLASWNPKGSPAFFAPGMKVSFFGDAVGCVAHNPVGVVAKVPDAALAHVGALSELPASDPSLSWTPSGNSNGCNGVADRTGSSMVYVHAGESDGGLVMYTSTGPRSDVAGTDFFGAFSAAGQDGSGTNANLTGTYAAFRQAWRGISPVRPWKADGESGSARIVVNQGLSRDEVGSVDSAMSQLQQFFTLHIINKTCLTESSTKVRPCQLNYVFTAAIRRNTISDWTSVAWANTVRVWYDPAQGGIPIVEGAIKSPGLSSMDRDTGLSLFTSQGNATHHDSYENQSFDVRISPDQLLNLLRILTSRPLGLAPAEVTPQQLAEMWGSGWADPDAWVMESVTVAQEISSADRSKAVWLAGNVRQVYVGPAGT